MQDVGDIYGEVFLELFSDDFRKLRQFKGKNGCTLATWIRIIASRATIDWIKNKAKREGIVEIRGLIPDYYQDPSPSPEQELVGQEEETIAESALNKLSAEDRLFFTLYYVRKMDVEAIAKALDVSVSTVYSKKNRLAGKLKKFVKKTFLRS